MRSFACWGRREEDFAQCEIWSLSEIRVYIQGGAGPTRPTSTGPEAKPLPIGRHGGVAQSVPAPPPSGAEQRPRSEQTGTSGGGNLNSTLQQSPDLAPFVRRVETQVRASSGHQPPTMRDPEYWSRAGMSFSRPVCSDSRTSGAASPATATLPSPRSGFKAKVLLPKDTALT